MSLYTSLNFSIVCQVVGILQISDLYEENYQKKVLNSKKEKMRKNLGSCFEF